MDDHVADEAVLGIMGAQGHRMGVSLFNAQIDVRHGAVEGPGTGVTERLPLLYHPPCEPEHVPRFPFVIGYLLLKSRRIRLQDKFRPLLPIADQPDGIGYIYGTRYDVFPLRNKENAEITLSFNLVDGFLQRL